MAEVLDAQSFMGQFGVSRETVERLRAYEAALLRWQKAINLIAPATLPMLWHRHFADSAQLATLIPMDARTLVDLGSGAGFPGLVLAIMLLSLPDDDRAGGDDGDKDGAGARLRRRLTRVVLVESDTRKAAFLRDAARLTGTAVEILSTRIEKCATEADIGKVDVVTARALAPMHRLLGLSVPLWGPETVGLFLKGQGVDAEIAAARAEFAFDVSLVSSLTHTQAAIAVVHRLGTGQAPAGRVEP